jgi:hypothetical protein
VEEIVVYYVYELSYPDGRVFYVGKGKKKRMYNHERDVKRKILNDTPNVDAKEQVIANILKSGKEVRYKQVYFTEDEQAAFQFECERILYHGVHNLTNFRVGLGRCGGY